MIRLKAVLNNQQDNYIFPFFWQHGEEEATLRRYMKAVHDANIGAVCVESRPHPDFVGDKWWVDMDVILNEAEKLGMKVWILDDSHFPTGYANGAMKDASVELHHKYLTCRTLEMSGPARQVSFNLKEYMKPASLPPWMPKKSQKDDGYADDELVKVLACEVLEGEEYGEPVDLTDGISENEVVFDLPNGYYRIFVVYITRNAGGRNDYINFLDKESCRILLDAVYEPHYAHYKKYFGNVIAGFFSDEPPVGNVNGYMPVGPIGVAGQDLPWAGAAMERFSQEYGSQEWKKLTPYLWGNARDKVRQAKVRNAYMNMVTKLIAECFSAQNGEWCRAHGVEYIGHQLEDCDMNTNLGASMGHFFRGLSGQHMAGVDNIGGQVTINGQNVSRHDNPACRDEAGFYQYMLGKLGASHGAIDPGKQGRCLCENFGAYGWQSGPREEKYMMDHFMVRGVNRYVPHAFSPAPFPDPDCPPHFYAHGENPTYRAFGELMAYSNRVCHLIDGGMPCPDVAVLYNAESVWSGDSTSNIPVCRYLTQAQVDFHIIPADVFDGGEEYPVSFDGKKLTINSINYSALVISGCAFVDSRVALFIENAAKSGFPVVFTDRRPWGIVAASKEENSIFVQKIQELEVVPVQQIGTYLRDDERMTVNTRIYPENRFITTYHYVLEGMDEYLILNEMAGSTYKGEVIVRTEGVPVRYYPWENRLENVEWRKTKNGSRSLAITIEPLELCILILLPEMEYKEIEGKIVIARPAASEGDGVIVDKFEVGRIEARDYLNLLEKAEAPLHSEKVVVKVTEMETVKAPFSGMQEKYPDFSGYYIYETRLSLKPEQDYIIKIDQVCEVVEIFFNGRSLGTKVQAPYRFDIPAGLVTNENELHIEVATLPERKVRAMGVSLVAMSPHRPMSPTGILGNVEIVEKSMKGR